MIVLLTNDDGIDSPGLHALEEVFREGHDVWTVAPRYEKSGTSHAITLRDPIRVHQLDERRFSLEGTPADCVLYSILGAIPVTPDVVISGINLGPNLGTDIIYSGTAAAAREAALRSIPGIALSLNSKISPFYFKPLARFVYSNLETLRKLWNPDHFININAPNRDIAVTDLEITHPARRLYRDSLDIYRSFDGTNYLFLQGAPPHAEPEEGSDWYAVNQDRVSISPVYLHPINHDPADEYDIALFREG